VNCRITGSVLSSLNWEVKERGIVRISISDRTTVSGTVLYGVCSALLLVDLNYTRSVVFWTVVYDLTSFIVLVRHFRVRVRLGVVRVV